MTATAENAEAKTGNRLDAPAYPVDEEQGCNVTLCAQ
jgi:hypothetical protein